jgi:signal transduction histidine kinase
MHTDVVETELPPDFEALDSWRSIKQGIRRIRQVVNDLLDLHRIGTTRRERVDINILVEEAMRLADSQLQARGIVQSADLDRNLPQIYGVSQHVYQIILNLLLNGAEAVGHDGSINVSTHGSDDSVFVEILDSGKGITPDELAQIFTPLYTGRKGRGTGLGLFVTYSLIKEHNGDIEVESRSGEGTRFRIRFPRAGTESAGSDAR